MPVRRAAVGTARPNALAHAAEPRGPQLREPRRVIIVALPLARMLDVFGPAEVIHDASRIHGGSPAYHVDVVSAGEARAVQSHVGTRLDADRSYREAAGPVDTLLVAGGLGAREQRCSREFLSWLRDQAPRARRFGSICTGAWVLAEAGLLDGRRATTHWGSCGELARRYPRVTVDPDPIYVRDGNCYTSAGVTAGIDMALALVEEDLGRAVALQVAQLLVVFLRRPGGQAQFSTTLAAQARERGTLGDLLAWMADHVRGDLSVAALARRAAMSPRNFARHFAGEVGTTPARYVEALRLEAARRRLESTTLSVEEVAGASGFGSAEILRRAFRRRLGVTPGQYRTTFGRAA